MKSKFSDCTKCPLKDQMMVVGETNCEDDLSKVRLLVLAEAPANEELKQDRPLVGAAGKIFRKAFKDSGLSTIKYFIGNVVSCANIQDGRTVNPPDAAVEACKPNWNKLIEVTKPEVILILGSVPMRAFGIGDSGITKKRGKSYDYNGTRVLLTLHPSYIKRNGGVGSKAWDDFYSDFESVSNILSPNVESVESGPKLTEPYSHKIPPKYYTEDYILMDIQYIKSTKEILYIFRNKDGKKEYYRASAGDKYFYYANGNPSNTDMIVNVADVELGLGYKAMKRLNKDGMSESVTFYEGDLSVVKKHSVDYRYNRRTTPEVFIHPKVMYADIEVFTGGKRGFPFPEEAKHPINAISFKVGDGKTHVMLARLSKMHDKKPNSGEFEYKEFKTERALIKAFCNAIKSSDVDIITGWNCLHKNSLLYTDKKIVKIKDVNVGDSLGKYGNVLNKWYTGEKTIYNIKAKCGFEISSSKDHIFPIYYKRPTAYKNLTTLLNTKKDCSVEEILELKKDNDIYLNIPIRTNTNENLTYRRYFIDNLKHLLQYDFFDIMICDEGIKDYICDKVERKKLIDIVGNISYFGKDYYKRCDKWTYKNLNEYIDLNMLTKYLEENDNHIFTVFNRRVSLNISKEIDGGDLQLLGLLYTDGFYSEYDKNYRITSKYISLIEGYKQTIDRFRTKPLNVSNILKRKFRDCYEIDIFGRCNIFSLLLPFIYSRNFKKGLNIEILSSLSFDQFRRFMYGMIDGDGCIFKNTISVCNFENNGKDLTTIHNLLLWNGIFSSKRKSDVFIFNNENKNTRMFYDSIILHNKEKLMKFDNKIKDKKNRISNNIKYFITDDQVLLKLIDINELEDKADMFDIETNTHYFVSNSILTHNCVQFDFQYILNRMRKLGMNLNDISPVGITEYNQNEMQDLRIFGLHVLDMLDLYKELNEGSEESYKLDYIARKNLGEGKIAYEGTLDSVYMENIDQFVEYSGVDTELLWELDTKLQHISLKFEMLRICASTWKVSETTTGLLDPLVILFAKNKNLVLKNSTKKREDDSLMKIIKDDLFSFFPEEELKDEGDSDEKAAIPGGYVRKPRGGIHSWLVDFDYASLYPSLMRSFNIGPNTYIAKIVDNFKTTENIHEDFNKTAYMFIYRREELKNHKFRIKMNPLTSTDEVDMSLEELEAFISKYDGIYSIAGTIFKGHNQELSFLNEIEKELMDKRKVYKKRRDVEIGNGNIEESEVFECMQKAYKILANACFTPDTEVVTLDGIKNVKDVEIGDIIFNVNPETQEIEIDDIVDIVENYYSGDIYEFSNSGTFDFKVTDYHKFVLNNNRIMTADEIYNKVVNEKNTNMKFVKCREYGGGYINRYIVNNNYSFLRYFYENQRDNICLYIFPKIKKDLRLSRKLLSRNILEMSKKFIHKGRSGRKIFLNYINSEDVDFFENSNDFDVELIYLDSENYHEKTNRYTLPALIDINAFSKFLGYFISEGCIDKTNKKIYTNTTRGVTHRIGISQCKDVNLNIYNDINEVLSETNIQYKVKNDNTGFWLCNMLLYKWLEFNCYNGKDKDIPCFILSLEKSVKWEFLISLYNGDGDKLGDIKRHKRYTTKSSYLRDKLINLWTSLGYHTRYHKEKSGNSEYFRITHFKCKHGISIKPEHCKKEKYNGKVYCVTTRKNHTLFAGRNGKFAPTHNCYGVLLNEHFRFFNIDLGTTITLSGREAIRYAGFHTSNFMKTGSQDIDPNFDIDYDEKDIPYLTYTDTDSIYVQIGDYMMDEGLI